MSFYCTRVVLVYAYYLDGVSLDRVYQFKDLGFLYEPSLDLHSQGRLYSQ